MVNEVYTGIAERLESIFEDKLPVYFDSLPQGFAAPCFFIQLLSASHELRLWNRYELVLNFDIMYFPMNERENDVIELNTRAYSLLYGLEYIPLDGGEVRGTDINYKIEDGVLHFFISYHIFILKTSERSPLMQRLVQQYGIK